MFKDNIISLEKKILNLISLPLKIVLEIIKEDEDLNYFDFKIIISDKINFSYNKEKDKEKEKSKDIPIEILKNEIEKFSEILNDNKIRVINIKKEENILKIYIAKEIYELLN
jgi:murein L,D-transpeptidase YafK